MKWLFITLIGLNLIVFAGMIAGKMWKEYKPAPAVATAQQPTQIIIHANDLSGNGGAAAIAASGVVLGKGGNTSPNVIKQPPVVKPEPPKPQPPLVKDKGGNGNTSRVETLEKPQASYKNCSARVSMPEDDYHRIKGLLGKYPHAASRQVVENTGDEGGQSTSRMNVLFMSVSDQEAGAIQAVVGRYGQLHRAPCNK